MATPVHPPRGMRDFLPKHKATREHALSIIRQVYRAHGFDEIETPVMEDYGRLHAGLGGDNEKLGFSVLKRGLTAEAFAQAAASNSIESLVDLGLRFDLTVPLCRFYASHRPELPPVFRAIQIAPVWRAERPQRGRYRQFVQTDIDIIGEPGLLAEIELITATAQALTALGLDGCVIRVNDRRVLFGLLAHCGFAAHHHDRALITFDKLDKIGVDGVVEELRAFDQTAAARLGKVLASFEPARAHGIALNRAAIESALPALPTPQDAMQARAFEPHSNAGDAADAAEGARCLAELGAALVGALPAGVSVCFDPTLVRGMGYYTGTIFEIAHPKSGTSVGGGGRYDGMIGRFLGQDVPAAGFSLGFERVLDLIKLPENELSDTVALLCDDDVAAADLISLKRELIAQGHRVRLEKRQKNMKTLLDRLVAEGVTSIARVSVGATEVSALELRPLGQI